MKTFWFDGESAAAHGLIVSGSGTFNAAERDVEMVSIPGRSGDLIVDKGRYKNIPVSYPASIYTDFAANAEACRAWLGSKTGYCRLEDDYDPDHFRMARFKGPLSFTPGFLNRTAECTIQFDCKPQRFLKSGERPVTVADGSQLRNPTAFPASPLLIVTCTAASAILYVKDAQGNSVSFVIDVADIPEQITLYLDSESGEVYSFHPESGTKQDRAGRGASPIGSPILRPGINIFDFWTIEGSIDAVQIVPRWWTL